MENNYCVYVHINKINNKKYVGVTRLDPPKRWKKGEGYRHQTFYKAIQKYGWDNFDHIILEDNLSFEEVTKKEQEWINKYESNNPTKGYNNTNGGLGIYPSTNKNKERPKKFGEESNGKSKKVKCVETGEIFGSINEAERWCDSTKVSECCKHQRKHAGHHPELHILLSWEYADENEVVNTYCHEHIINPKKNYSKGKRVLCIETNEIFNSESEACEFYKCSRGTIGRACNGIRKTALKKHWKWID